METLQGEGRSPFDSTLHSEHGVSFMERLMDVVKECLREVLEGCPVAKCKSLEGCLEELEILPGMLKTGKMEIHQEVHIDDLDLIIQGDLLRKVVTNEEDSATSEELLLAGYVVDVPLSFEGSWIRVGIWNADDGVVEMVPVHVPFGSVLVRCNTLPHSGNYGSPGNTRFHAQLRIVINIIGRKLPPRKSYKSLGWCM